MNIGLYLGVVQTEPSACLCYGVTVHSHDERLFTGYIKILTITILK